MADQRVFNTVIRAMRKEMAWVGPKSILLMFLANFIVILLFISSGIKDQGLSLVAAIINFLFVHFGYTVPKMREIGAKYKKALEDHFKKDISEIFREYGGKDEDKKS